MNLDEIDIQNVRSTLSSAVISDILDDLGYRNQCLAAGLAPLEDESKVVGWAYPVEIERVSSVPEFPFRGLVEALDKIGPDDVFVTPTGRAADIAVWGELLSTACRARGAAGALTDGMVRDTSAIRAMGFPVIAGGTIPYDSKGRHEILGVRDHAVLDGIEIARGDLIVGDSDGVVIVPRALAAQVILLALEKRSSEVEFRDAVAGGMLASAAFDRFGVL